MKMGRLLVATIGVLIPGFAFAGIVVANVPEPTTLALLGAGIAGVAAVRRWKRK